MLGRPKSKGNESGDLPFVILDLALRTMIRGRAFDYLFISQAPIGKKTC